MLNVMVYFFQRQLKVQAISAFSINHQYEQDYSEKTDAVND